MVGFPLSGLKIMVGFPLSGHMLLFHNNNNNDFKVNSTSIF